MSKVWLVTGSASGLGRNIAEAVLACGDRLVATARDPRRLEDLMKRMETSNASARTEPTTAFPLRVNAAVGAPRNNLGTKLKCCSSFLFL